LIFGETQYHNSFEKQVKSSWKIKESLRVKQAEEVSSVTLNKAMPVIQKSKEIIEDQEGEGNETEKLPPINLNK
jgi:hypothetical protein